MSIKQVLLIISTSVIHFIVSSQLLSATLLMDNIHVDFNVTDTSIITGTVIAVHTGGQCLSSLVYSLNKDNLFFAFLFISNLIWFSGVFFSTYSTNAQEFFWIYTILVGVGGSNLYWGVLYILYETQTSVYTSIVSGAFGELFYLLIFDHTIWRSEQRIFAVVGLLVIWVNIIVLRISTVEDEYMMLANELKHLCFGYPEINKDNVANFNIIFYTVVFLSTIVMLSPYIQFDESFYYLDTYERNALMVYLIVSTLVGKFFPEFVDTQPKTLYLYAQPFNLFIICMWQLVIGWFSAAIFTVIYGFLLGINYSSLLGISYLSQYKRKPINVTHIYLIPVTLAMCPAIFLGSLLFKEANLSITNSIWVMVGFQACAVLLSIICLSQIGKCGL